MNLSTWAALINQVSNGTPFATAVANIAALDLGTNFGVANTTEMNAQESYILTQASLPWEKRDSWYQANSPFFNQLSGGTPIYGPNILASPFGPYASAPWTASFLTETTGQTDPFGGTQASLLTDTATSTVHAITQTLTIPAATYFLSFYFKPGTYTGGIFIGLNGASPAISVTNLGVVTIYAGTVTNITSTTVGGFFYTTCKMVSVGNSNFQLYFGVGGPTYLGTLENQTVYNLSLQLV